MLIGLSGWAGSGKDEVGRILVENHGFTRLAFADALKKVALDCHPEVRRLVSLYGWEGAKQYDDVRFFLQDLGLAMRKHVVADVWVEALMREIEQCWHIHYVITDCRFWNEATTILDSGGVMLRIHRPDVKPSRAHVSETELDDWNFDGHLFNDSTIEVLGARVGDLLERLRIGQKAA